MKLFDNMPKIYWLSKKDLLKTTRHTIIAIAISSIVLGAITYAVTVVLSLL